MERDEDQNEQKAFSPENYLIWSEGLYIEYGWKQTKDLKPWDVSFSRGIYIKYIYTQDLIKVFCDS